MSTTAARWYIRVTDKHGKTWPIVTDFGRVYLDVYDDHERAERTAAAWLEMHKDTFILAEVADLQSVHRNGTY